MVSGATFRFFIIFLTVLVASTGYGVSFPLLAILLEKSGVSSGLIGLNAAMPALGWLLISPFLPKLHRHIKIKTILIGFLLVSVLGLIGITTTTNFWAWLVFRLLFGGGLGMFFRVIEYWINTATQTNNRGKIIGIYSIFFLTGLIIGSILQPILENNTFAYIFIIFCHTITILILFMIKLSIQSHSQSRSNISFSISLVYATAPIAIIGIIVYGFFEDVSAYLLSIYAVKVGLGEQIAAYTLAAIALGNVLLGVPIGGLSDRIGRMPLLYACTLVGFLGSIIIPFVTQNPIIFLFVLVIWGGCLGSIYNICLSMIGDNFNSEYQLSANLVFGIFYAIAATIGPLISGGVMQIWEPHGLMVSCAILFGGFFIFIYIHSKLKAVENAI